MTKRRPQKRAAAIRGRATYVFRLFVAGAEPNSAQASANLVLLCEAHIAGQYEIRVVDVLTNPKAAYTDNVIVTPTLIMVRPLPQVTVFGNLRDAAQVLAALRLGRDR